MPSGNSDIQSLIREHAWLIRELAHDARTYHTNTVDEDSIAAWLLQWRDPRSVAMALKMLQQVSFIDGTILGKLLKSAVDKVPAHFRQSALLSTLGQTYDSAGLVAYTFAKACGETESKFVEQWIEIRALGDHAAKDRALVLLDDNVTSGTQLVQFFSEMRPHHVGPREHLSEPLSEDTLRALTQMCIYVAVGIELDDPKEKVRELEEQQGWKLSIVSGQRDTIDYLQCGSIWRTPEDVDFARWRISEVSRDLLKSKSWSEATLEQRLLGYGNRPKFTIFAHNVPKSLPAPFWKFGVVDSQVWVPLFPEQAEWTANGPQIREQRDRQIKEIDGELRASISRSTLTVVPAQALQPVAIDKAIGVEPQDGVVLIGDGDRRYTPNGEFVVDVNFYVLAGSSPISLLAVDFDYYAYGCLALKSERMSLQTRKWEVLEVSTDGELGAALRIPPESRCLLLYRRRFRPPLMNDAPVDCDGGDVVLTIKWRLPYEPVTRIHRSVFRIPEHGRGLTTAEELREPPRVTERELQFWHEAGRLSAEDFAALMAIDPVTRYRQTFTSNASDYGFGIEPRLVALMRELARSFKVPT